MEEPRGFESGRHPQPSRNQDWARAGLEQLDESLREFSDEDLEALLEQARRRASALAEDEVAAIIAEGLRAARAQGRP